MRPRVREETLNRATKRGLPVVGANYGGSEGTASDLPMDWGTLIPLWFVTRGRKNDPKVVIVTPSREIPLSQNYEFGRLVAELAEKKSKRYVFIASAGSSARPQEIWAIWFQQGSVRI